MNEYNVECQCMNSTRNPLKQTNIHPYTQALYKYVQLDDISSSKNRSTLNLFFFSRNL